MIVGCAKLCLPCSVRVIDCSSFSSSSVSDRLRCGAILIRDMVQFASMGLFGWLLTDALQRVRDQDSRFLGTPEVPRTFTANTSSVLIIDYSPFRFDPNPLERACGTVSLNSCDNYFTARLTGLRTSLPDLLNPIRMPNFAPRNRHDATRGVMHTLPVLRMSG